VSQNDKSGELGQLKVSFVIFAAVLAVLSVLVLHYVWRDSGKAPSEAISESSVAQPVMPDADQPGPDPAQQERQSEEAAKRILTGLKHFQGATESSMSYEEYDEMLTRLRADLNNTLPSFVGHNSSDEAFRREAEAALRDYTAAGNWWKTTIRHSSVLNEADRDERVKADWSSAQTHLNNAEKLLLP